MNNLEKAKEIIKDMIMYGCCGIFNTRNVVGDSMVNLYNNNGLVIDICYYFEYFEVFGLSEEEFSQLKEYYNHINSSIIRGD